MTAILNFIRYMHALVLLSVPHESFNDWGRLFNGCSSESTNMCAALTTFLASLVPIIAMAANPYESYSATAALAWSLMPIVGALLASTTAFFLNKVTERPRAVAGRVICSLVFGVGIPRALIYYFPTMGKAFIDPFILVLGSYLIGMFGYAVAAYLVDKAIKESPGIVDKGMEKITDSISTKVAEKMSAPVLPPGD